MTTMKALPIIKERNCLICNRLFKASSCSKQKYCSIFCYSISIKGKPSHRKGMSAIKEYGEEKAKQISKKISGSRKGILLVSRIKKTCLYCNKEFEVSPTNKKFLKKKFCSYKCSNIYNAKPKQSLAKIICKNCGKEIEIPKSAKRTYCSKNCSDEGRKGLKRTIETRKRIKQTVLEQMSIKENRDKISLGMLRYFVLHPERKEQIKNENLERLKDPEYVKKILIYGKTTRNKTENEVDQFIQNNFPNEFEYTGDGKIIIEKKIPDWTHLYKLIIIELYGNHWHTQEEAEERIKFFAKYGYKALIIWASDFYHNKKKIKNEITSLLEGP